MSLHKMSHSANILFIDNIFAPLSTMFMFNLHKTLFSSVWQVKRVCQRQFGNTSFSIIRKTRLRQGGGFSKKREPAGSLFDYRNISLCLQPLSAEPLLSNRPKQMLCSMPHLFQQLLLRLHSSDLLLYCRLQP